MLPPNPFYCAQPDFKKLYVYGCGGAGRGIAWLVRQSWGNAVELVFLVDKPEFLKEEVHGYPVMLLSDVVPEESARYVIAVAHPAERRRITPVLDAIPLKAASLFHPRAETSEFVEFARGTILCVGTIVSNESRIGEHCYINANTMIGHDVAVGSYTTFSPNVNVAGYVNIGEGVFFGLGANIINGSPEEPLVIGDNAYIAAGACVTKSVPAGAVMAGVPAVRIK